MNQVKYLSYLSLCMHVYVCVSCLDQFSMADDFFATKKFENHQLLNILNIIIN
jgi:hypothetical protein